MAPPFLNRRQRNTIRPTDIKKQTANVPSVDTIKIVLHSEIVSSAAT